jgi:hypothetical protein
VALILRYNNGKLVLFEATGYNGVATLDWKNFKMHRYYQLYSKIVFRHLNMIKDPTLILELENFIKVIKNDSCKQTVVGKKYKLNPIKIFRRKSRHDASHNIKEEKSYFCSELVASAYKRMGLIDSETSAS